MWSLTAQKCVSYLPQFFLPRRWMRHKTPFPLFLFTFYKNIIPSISKQKLTKLHDVVLMSFPLRVETARHNSFSDREPEASNCVFASYTRFSIFFPRSFPCLENGLARLMSLRFSVLEGHAVLLLFTIRYFFCSKHWCSLLSPFCGLVFLFVYTRTGVCGYSNRPVPINDVTGNFSCTWDTGQHFVTVKSWSNLPVPVLIIMWRY
jgi:hypothetical protein